MSVLLALGALWKIPEWQAGRVAGQTPAQRVALEDEFRKTLATILAGLFVLFTGYLTWRNVSIAQATLATNQETLATTQEGQITDRYIRAIEQLGATQDGNPIIESRLGGIYALERIARDSLRDHVAIMGVLTAYVRHNAPTADIEEFDPAKKYELRVDIQAVLTVIGRRTEEQRAQESDKKIDLSATNLRGANFFRAHLEGANLRRARLEGASFWHGHLEDAALRGAHLEGASFTHAHLERANLREAFLEGAKLRRAHLEGASFKDAKDLSQAQIEEAYLDKDTLLTEPLQRSVHNAPGLLGEDAELSV